MLDYIRRLSPALAKSVLTPVARPDLFIEERLDPTAARITTRRSVNVVR
jgi:hypothetical protein